MADSALLGVMPQSTNAFSLSPAMTGPPTNKMNVFSPSTILALRHDNNYLESPK